MPNFDLTSLELQNADPINTEFLLRWTGDLSEFSFFVTGRAPNLRAAMWFKEADSTQWRRGTERRITQNTDIFLRPVSDPRYTGLRVYTRGVLGVTLAPETTYDFRLYVWDGNSAFRSNINALPTGTPLDFVEARLRTSRTQGLRQITATPDTNEVRVTLASTTTRTVIVYHRYRRLGRDWIDGTPRGYRVGANEQFGLTVGGDLYPNRDYEIQISDFADYNPHLPINTKTLNLVIPGVSDPSLSFDQTVGTFDLILGLDDWSMRTGELPAGYIQEPKADELLTLPSMLVQEFGYQLARRIGAGAFERADGSWRFISKTLWADQPLAAVFTLDRFKITEQTLRNELREQLDISEFRYTAWQFSQGGDDPTGEQSVTVRGDTNPTKTALSIDNRIDLGDLFIIIPGVPGNLRELIARFLEPTPLIVLADIQAILDDDTASAELHTIQPGQNLTIELPHTQGTVTYTGTLINKRIFGSNYGRLMSHRLTIWAHNAVLSTGEPLVWSQGNWNEKDWS